MSAHVACKHPTSNTCAVTVALLRLPLLEPLGTRIQNTSAGQVPPLAYNMFCPCDHASPRRATAPRRDLEKRTHTEPAGPRPIHEMRRAQRKRQRLRKKGRRGVQPHRDVARRGAHTEPDGPRPIATRMSLNHPSSRVSRNRASHAALGRSPGGAVEWKGVGAATSQVAPH